MMCCLRRALERLRLFVGGPLMSASPVEGNSHYQSAAGEQSEDKRLWLNTDCATFDRNISKGRGYQPRGATHQQHTSYPFARGKSQVFLYAHSNPAPRSDTQWRRIPRYPLWPRGSNGRDAPPRVEPRSVRRPISCEEVRGQKPQTTRPSSSRRAPLDSRGDVPGHGGGSGMTWTAQYSPEATHEAFLHLTAQHSHF